jgi:putative ABC transport system permease protein
MSRRRRYGTGALLLRDVLAHPGPWAVFAGTVAALATAATALPLALETITVSEAGHGLAALSDSDRLLLATTEGGPLKNPGGTDFTAFLDELNALPGDGGEELDEALGETTFASTSEPLPVVNGPSGGVSPFVVLTVAPGYADEVTVAEGTLPASFSDVETPIDVALPAPNAEALGWELGEQRVVGVEQPLTLRLSAILSPRDAEDDYWALLPTALEPQRSESFHLGVRTRIATVSAFIEPESFWALKRERALPMTTTAAFPIDASAIPAGRLGDLEHQLRRFLADSFSVGEHRSADFAWKFQFTSAAPEAIAAALGRAATAGSVTAVAMAGPIGVAAALLWLLATLFIGRRRESLALLASRGAGVRRIRLALAVEALLIGGAAATAGAVIAIAAFGRLPLTGGILPGSPAPGPLGPGTFLPAAVVVAGAAILLGAAAGPRGTRATRSDLAARARGTARWVLELMVLVATAVSLALLVQRGLAPTALGFDPLLAAAPLLLALSAGLLVLRVYPLPLLALHRGARSGRGVVGFLGSARAIRSPGTGLAAVLAVIVGLGVTLFSVVLLDTVRTGIVESSASVIGADLRVSGGPLSPDQLSELADLPGVEEAVGVFRYSGQKKIVDDGEQTSIALVVADIAALARVQSGVPGAPRGEGDMTTRRGDSIPVVLSAEVARSHPDARGLLFSGSHLLGIGTPGSTPSLAPGGRWVLVDSAFSEDLGVVNERPTVALLDLSEGADVATVADPALRIAGETSTVLDPATAAGAQQSTPVIAWLQLILVAVSVVMALACAAACILALLVAAPATRRLLALLRALGLDAAQARGVAAWEIAPVAVVGVVAGCAAGLALPLLVVPALDLRPFTGGPVLPRLSIDLVSLGLIALGFLLVVALTTAIVIVTTRRLRVAAALRNPVE